MSAPCFFNVLHKQVFLSASDHSFGSPLSTVCTARRFPSNHNQPHLRAVILCPLDISSELSLYISWLLSWPPSSRIIGPGKDRREILRGHFGERLGAPTFFISFSKEAFPFEPYLSAVSQHRPGYTTLYPPGRSLCIPLFYLVFNRAEKTWPPGRAIRLLKINPPGSLVFCGFSRTPIS